MANIEPLVSVIMPIRNEADFIERSLGAVLNQDYPHDHMEVLIADGMSDDDTRAVVQRLAASSDIPVRIVDNPGKIVPTGFNAALKPARGDIIVRVDGHTVIASDYVQNCVRLLQVTQADNVGGPMCAIGTTGIGETIAIATSTPFGVGGARFHYSQDEEWVDTVYMGAWWKDIFARTGDFDEEFVRNQDDEFNYRLRANEGKILLSPDVKSKYYTRSSLYTLWRQYYQYGLYKVPVMQKHPTQMRIRQFAPPIFVAALFGGGGLAIFNGHIRRLWQLVVTVYTLANLVASIWTARESGWKHLPLLPVVFGILHISYGMGFIHGLIKFWKRWHDR